MKQEFTLTVYTENQVGLLNKIAIIFSRRKISLDSFNSSPSEIENIYRFTIVIRETETVVKNIVRQLEKNVEVFKVFYNTNDEIIWQQIALYKVPTSVIMKEVKVERLLREFGARAVVIRDDYTVFETTGQDDEVDNLLTELSKYSLIKVDLTSSLKQCICFILRWNYSPISSCSGRARCIYVDLNDNWSRGRRG